MSKKDTLESGRKMLNAMMKEAQRPDSKVPFEDKLKLLDRWVKFQQLEKLMKQGGMGSGFDAPGGDDDEAGDV